MKQTKSYGALLVSALFFFTACDFTPPVNRKIIDAQSYIADQKYDKAVFLYEKILDSNLEPELRMKICFQLGELNSIYVGNYKKAVKYYSEVKTLTEEPLWLIKIEEKLAEINFTYLKNYTEALKNYQSLTEFRPVLKRNDYFQFQIALSYYNLKNYDKALEALNEIQKNPNHEYFIRSFYYIGLVFFEKKDYNMALFQWTEYTKRETKKENIVMAKFWIANVFEMTENLKDAYDLYYSILNDYPNQDVIQNRLNAVYNRRVARKR